MWKVNSFALLTIISCLFTSISNAQRNVENQQLLWTGYSLKLNINDKYTIRQDLDERNYWFPWRQHQFVSRTFAERRIEKDWNLGLGLTYSLQSLPNDPLVSSYENKIELRPQLEIAYNQRISGKLLLHHRYWGEFRFSEQNNGSIKHENNRARYRIELRYSPIDNITLKAFDEIFINIGGEIVQNVFDQNRYGTSIQYMPIKNLGFELGYFNLFQQRNTGVDFYNRNIIRFTIHHTINLKKSKPEH